MAAILQTLLVENNGDRCRSNLVSKETELSIWSDSTTIFNFKFPKKVISRNKETTWTEQTNKYDILARKHDNRVQ